MRLSGGAYPKRFQPIEDGCALMLDNMLRVELERGETLEQCRDSDLCLGAGKRRRVMPSSEQRTGHRLTSQHLPATDLQGLQRKASDLHHRRVVAQHLLG